jgi:hypothetical protein
MDCLISQEWPTTWICDPTNIQSSHVM